MIEIIPAVMPYSKDDLVEKIFKVKDFAKRIQIDVMDGNFVPSISWPYGGGDLNDISEYKDLNLSIDLMVSNPEVEAMKWVDAGVRNIIVHVESISDRNFLVDLKSRGIEITLALAPSTSNTVLNEYEGLYSSVQFMGIEKVGYQGESFVPDVLNKIKELRDINKDIDISVDGGVSFDTAKDLVQAGANILISGSQLFESEDIEGTYNEFLEIVS